MHERALQVFLLLRRGEQAKLGTAPQHVLRLCYPLFGAQVVDFADIEAATQVVTQIGERLHAFLGHAVLTAQVALICQRHAQIRRDAPETVDETGNVGAVSRQSGVDGPAKRERDGDSM